MHAMCPLAGLGSFQRFAFERSGTSTKFAPIMATIYLVFDQWPNTRT